MTKNKKSLLALVALVALAGVFAAFRVASYAPAGDPAADPRVGDLGYAWRGAVHVHSLASDGAGEIDEIMAAASEAGLDFVVVSDHNPLLEQRVLEQRAQTGWHGDVLLIVAEEISTKEGHVLAFGIPGHRYRFGPVARQALSDIHEEGGWALVAHSDHAWQGWRGGWGGTEGLEVANLAAAWSRQSVLSAASMLTASFVDPDYAATKLLGNGWPALQTWDRLVHLDQEEQTVPRRRVAVGAADAHGPVVGPIPGYADTLSVLTTLVWIATPPRDARGGDPRRFEAELLDSLRAGRAAVEVTAIGDARAFSFVAMSASTRATMGDFAAWERGPWRLRVGFDSPDPAEIVVLRDGKQVAATMGRSIETEVAAPGTYRVAVYRPGVAREGGLGPPWLISNPIYVWPAEARAAATVHRAPPLPAPPLSLDLLDEVAFGSDDRGVSVNTVQDAGDGFSWNLELERESDRDAFAAMAWRPAEPVDWSEAEGVVVGLRARRTLRVDLEVRAFDSAGRTESWGYSLKAAPGSDATAVPWSRFRSLSSADLREEESAQPEHPEAADLRRVNGLFFIVTPTSLAPGSNAALHLEVLGLYGGR